MSLLHEVYITESVDKTPVSSIMRYAMQIMKDDGYVKITNNTGGQKLAFESPYEVLDEAVPKFYYFAKHPSLDLWEEYDGTIPHGGSSVRGKGGHGVTTLSTESQIHQRLMTRMQNRAAYRIQIFDKMHNGKAAFDRGQINFRA
jgi:hypothetical protein